MSITMDWINNILSPLGGPSFLIVAGGLLSIFGGVLASRQESKLQDKIVAETLKNSDLIVSETLNAVTGGDSYMYFEPLIDKDEQKLALVLFVRGKYPLYDVMVFKDEFTLNTSDPKSFKYEKTSTDMIRMGTVFPSITGIHFKWELPTQTQIQSGKRYFLSIRSRNGIVEEDIYIRREGPHLTQAWRVVNMGNLFFGGHNAPNFSRPRALIRRIDAGFPSHELPTGGAMIHWDFPHEDQ